MNNIIWEAETHQNRVSADKDQDVDPSLAPCPPCLRDQTPGTAAKGDACQNWKSSSPGIQSDDCSAM